MSVYGRAVRKLTVLSSEGRKNRTKRQETLSGEYQDHAVMVCDAAQFGTGIQTFGKHLQPSPSIYPEEGGS
jgi:hypothetical protein